MPSSSTYLIWRRSIDRRSEKWTGHDRDVLVATIAEMDFPLAEPVVEVLRAAIDCNDLGYTQPMARRLRDAFARRRLRWHFDPEQMTLVPDVMVGLVELARVLAGPDGAAAFVAPAYPLFFTALPEPSPGSNPSPRSMTAPLTSRPSPVPSQRDARTLHSHCRAPRTSARRRGGSPVGSAHGRASSRVRARRAARR